MARKAKHLIDQIISRETLERGADDALKALEDRSVWYAQKFIKNRKECLDMIQNMVMLGEYPKKEYKTVIHHGAEKDREICPQYFFPWSILYHAVKIVLEPIAERVLIDDSSAGRKGKGQTYGALRVKQLIRRYPEYTHFSQSDIRKFYQSIPHTVVIEALECYISDPLFIKLIKETMLDYSAPGIEEILEEEQRRKRAYCHWASREPMPEKYRDCMRGITIGSCISQIIGNLVLTRIDRLMKEKYKVKVYHRHCDDIFMGARSQEEAQRNLSILDYEIAQLGLVLKASSFAARLEDEESIENGRRLDYVGYVFSRHNMRVRKRSKVRFAKALARVKSRRRRQEILAAYWGIVKWGNARNLWRTITRQDIMAFREFGITVKEVSEKDGHRFFNVPQVSTPEILNLPIRVVDFEDGLTIHGKGDRCAVIFESGGVRKKFITSSAIIREQLHTAREMEENGTTIFPVDTVVRKKSIGDGKSTYVMD